MSESLPPGPKLRLLQTVMLLRDPYGYYARNAAKYGDTFTVPAINGTVIATGNPEFVKAIFAADPDTYDPFAADAIAGLVGANSVFALTGGAHKRERKLLMPPFQGERMRMYGADMIAAAERHISKWAPGTRVSILDSAHTITLEVIIRTIFGIQSPARVLAVSESITALVKAAHPALLFLKGLRRRFWGFGPYARFSDLRDKLDSIFIAEMKARRDSGEYGPDILSILLQSKYDDGEGMSDIAICDELRTLLFAGHETTAITLSWAFYWLHRNPETLSKLREELDALPVDAAPDVIVRLPYLDAVCSETLRLYPILPDVLRTLKKPLTLGEYVLPAGYAVAPVSALTHYNPEIFPEPQVFKPERFIGRAYKPNEYMPFGGGARRCVGAAFASYELRLVLATILRAFELKPSTDEAIMPVRRNATMGPSTGVEMVIVQRRLIEKPLPAGVAS